MHSFTVDGTDLGYSDTGQGAAVFLVHAGVFSGWFLPVSQSAALDQFRVINVRRAGYGEHVPEHVPMATHAAHLASLADRLGIAKLHFVGHSSSCQIGLALALQRPDLVASLVLLEPAPVGGFAVPASAHLAEHIVGPAMQAFASGDIALAFDTFMSGVCGDQHRPVMQASLGEAGVHEAVQQSSFFFRDEVRSVVASTFTEDDAAQVRQPVLLLEGDDSHTLGPLAAQVTELARRLLPHAEMAYVPGTTHMMPLQQPQVVAELVRNFIVRQRNG
ncbi:putative hydrolase [Luteitalea pratensis]|uniref:Putative hydrolase n=1 Tax=Luteitalea pratensis TaxID=1855912 RepID=A0A143PLQ4_LUTPR|nr:alpha/beta hydrolase [Luteitalea pratensis]AMY09356.1 putative hydrolase [Luteitalea pratensis]